MRGLRAALACRGACGSVCGAGGWLLLGGALAAPWALGVLLLTPQAAEEASGPCVVAALAVAAVSAILAALTRAELECPGATCGASGPAAKGAKAAALRRFCPRHAAAVAAAEAAAAAPRAQGPAERLLAHLAPLWLGLLAGVAASAGAARALAAAMDYIAGGRGRRWLEARVGFMPAMLGGALPDPLAAAVALAPHALCALGLERSWGLRLLLNVSVGSALVFFVSLGAAQADPDNWTAEPPAAAGWAALLPAAALLTAGFAGYWGALEVEGVGARARAARAAAALLFAMLSYTALSVVLAMMVGYSRALWGSEVPLLQAFELRDVDWARLVMAVLSVLGLALAMLELAAPAHVALASLAGDQWRLLPRGLSRESTLTGAPAAAAGVAGTAAAVLALLCPLRPLLRLGAGAALLERSAAAAALLLRRFRPDADAAGRRDARDDGPRYKRLRRSSGATATAPAPPGCPRCDGDDDEGDGPRRHRLTVRCLKSGLNFLPAALRQSRPQHYYTSLSSASPEPGASPAKSAAVASSTRRDGGVVAAGYRAGRLRRDAADEELLLLSPGEVGLEEALAHAGPDAPAPSPVPDAEEVDEEETETEEEEEEEDPESSTDIDAVVAEYKEKIQVATVTSPTPVPGAGGEPTKATYRRAALALAGTLGAATLASLAAAMLPLHSALPCGGVAAAAGVAALVVAARQPRAPRPTPSCPHRVMPAAPWLPAGAASLDLLLCAHTLSWGVWVALYAWVLVGWLLMRRQLDACGCVRGCCGRVPHYGGGGGDEGGGGGGAARRERIRLHAPPRQATRCTLVPSHRRLPEESAQRLTQVDTILISR